MSYEIEQKPAPKQSWFTPEESNNYYKTRYSREGITIHWWGGNEQESAHDAIVAYFLRQGELRVKSTNFVVSDAKVTQMVDPDMVAWCSQGGNPTTVSIEFEPNLSDEGYKRGAWLIATLEKKYGRKLNLYPHSKWVATSCPGSIDIARLRREADAITGGTLPAPTPVQPAPTPPPSAGAQTVRLPSNVATWAAYRVGSAYRKGTTDQVGTLLPSKFGGLTYRVVENRGNVVVIDTEAFGRVAIWVQGTEAVISSGSTSAAPVPPSSTGTVTFPAHVDSWAVYKVDSSYVKGSVDQVGTIRPAMFGGLTYRIIERRPNVVVIDTQNFGRVAAWVSGTDAAIS